MRLHISLAAAAAVLALATNTVSAPPALAKKQHAAKKQHTAKPAAPPEEPVPGSVLTKSEMELDCKRMSGRMQIRIMELRGGGPRTKGSGLAQGLQGAMAPIFGGTTRGVDPAGDNARDIARLKAMNQQLITKKCPYYDLDSELAKDRTAPTPRLVRATAQGHKTKQKGKATINASKAVKPAAKTP